MASRKVLLFFCSMAVMALVTAQSPDDGGAAEDNFEEQGVLQEYEEPTYEETDEERPTRCGRPPRQESQDQRGRKGRNGRSQALQQDQECPPGNSRATRARGGTRGQGRLGGQGRPGGQRGRGRQGGLSGQ